MATQAQQIRDIVQDILADNSQLQLVSASMTIKGIRYTDLKHHLTTQYTQFSEGAINTCLNTLTTRLRTVLKIKTEKGTFFYLRQSDNKSQANISTNLLTMDIERMQTKIQKLTTDVKHTIEDAHNRSEQLNDELILLHETLVTLTNLSYKYEKHQNQILIDSIKERREKQHVTKK